MKMKNTQKKNNKEKEGVVYEKYIYVINEQVRGVNS